MSYNLFLDDFRVPMDVLRYMPKYQYYVDKEWDIVRNYDEFVKIVTEKGIPQAVSFDHDLAAVTQTLPSQILLYRGWTFSWSHGIGTITSIYNRENDLIYQF